MKVAVDIDGTITKWPAACLAIMTAFPDSVILTGYSGRQPVAYEKLLQERIAQLTPIIGVPQRLIHICVGRSISHIAELKGQYCRDNHIDLLIDDHDEYCAAVRKLSPKTAVWKALR